MPQNNVHKKDLKHENQLDAEDNLPKGWIYARIKDIVKNEKHAIKRGPFGSHLKKEFFVKSGYKVYEQQHAIKNDFDLGNYYIDGKKFKELKAFEVNSGDLIISCSGTIGKIARVPKKFKKGIINQALLKISINTNIMTISYFRYLFQFWTKKDEIKSHGSGMKNLSSVNVLKEIQIPLPSLPEQKRIVAKIESIFTQIDVAKERLEVLASQVKSSSGSLSMLKSSILKQAFEGGLVPQDPNDEPAEILLRKIHKDSTKELIFEKDNLPKGWVRISLSEICTTKSGGTPSRKNPEYFGGNISWIKSGELNDSIIFECKETISKLGLEKSNAVLYPKNTILMAMYGATIGKLSILGFSASTNQAICALSHNEKIMMNMYLFLFLKSIRSDLISIGFGGAQKNISQEKIKKIQIPLSPLNEQKRIVSKIESIFGRIDAIFFLIHILTSFIILYFIHIMTGFSNIKF